MYTNPTEPKARIHIPHTGNNILNAMRVGKSYHQLLQRVSLTKFSELRVTALTTDMSGSNCKKVPAQLQGKKYTYHFN